MSWMPKRTVSKETAPMSIHDIFPFVNIKTAQFQRNHLDFKYPTDQTMCLILEKLSNPSILIFVLGAQKNRLKEDGSCEHPWHFSIR